MAKSRTSSKNTNKSKKSRVPKWAIAGVVVLVVAVAGYAIVRFSEASGYNRFGTSYMSGCVGYTEKAGTKACKITNVDSNVLNNTGEIRVDLSGIQWFGVINNRAQVPKNVCVNFSATRASEVSIKASVDLTGPFNAETGTSSRTITSNGNGYTLCRSISEEFNVAAAKEGRVKVTVRASRGYVAATSIQINY